MSDKYSGNIWVDLLESPPPPVLKGASAWVLRQAKKIIDKERRK